MMVNHNDDDRLRQKEQDKLLFHDFLGSKTATLLSTSMAEHMLPRARDKEAKLSTTPSTASASSVGGRSDLVEKQGSGGGKHLDGRQLFGPRSEVSGSIMSNRFSGTKRSNSESQFTAQEHPETLHWSKMLRNGPGSLSMNMTNQPPCGGGQISHLLHQLTSSRFKDENVGPSVIAQTAADEGSRTGMKGPGIMSHFTIPNRSKVECFAPSRTGNRKDLTSSTKQMTIFYGGQAHVFDDVHPNNADVIMTLAGSTGGSLSSDLSTEFRARPGHQATSGACNRIFTQPGRVHQGSNISRGREIRDLVHVSDPEKKPHD